MLRHTFRLVAGASSTGFSSAAFTGDDDGDYEHAERERARLREENVSSTDAHGASGSGAATAGPSTRPARPEDRPTIETYRAMSDDELITLLQTREKQVKQLRTIYENFHYMADKAMRAQVLDYHDKALLIAKVHGKMQNSSLQTNRETLARMREEQEMFTRDKRLMLTVCSVVCLVFWIWVRSHYMKVRDLENSLYAAERVSAPPVFGMGRYDENIFSSKKRNARNWETSWEREVRERQEAKAKQASTEMSAKLDSMMAAAPTK